MLSSVKMDNVIENNTDPSTSLIENEWQTNQNLGQDNANNTLLYIAVEYVKDDYKNDPPDSKDFANLSAEVAPIYSDQPLNFVSPVVIHQVVNQTENGWTGNLDAENLLVNYSLPDDKKGRNEQVEIVITDQATGISYAVSTHELLVGENLEEQQLLESLAPDLDPEFLSIDDAAFKENLATDLIQDVDPNDLVETGEVNDNESVTRRRKPTELESEEQLLSKVYAISDKPVLSRARATLPENYLSINKIEGTEEYGVFAKKCIRKRTQFGPMHGIVRKKLEASVDSDGIQLLIIDQNGKLFELDVSNENSANWMRFVRKAETYAEQNVVLSQHDESLYFTVTRNVQPKQELRVGYSAQYARAHNLLALEDEPERSWLCFECAERFATSRELHAHLDAAHDETARDEGARPRRRQSRKRRRPSAGVLEALACRICRQVVNPPKLSALKNHLVSKHNMADVVVNDYFVVVKNYRCEKCNIAFNMDSLQKLHKQLHQEPVDVIGAEECTCPACAAKFSTRRQLAEHASAHALRGRDLIPERFRCPVCRGTYAHRERLQRHMLVHGPDEAKPFACGACRKRFVNRSALACHAKVHGGAYECPICDARFERALELRAHVPSHRRADGAYACPHCPKQFRAYGVARKHVRAFHSARRFPCCECGKAFRTDDKLKQHALSHSDHREFLCADCGTQFKRKDKLNAHWKRFHGGGGGAVEARRAKAKKNVTKMSLTDFDRFIYKCHPCMIGFKRRGMLVNHLAKRHPDVSPDSVPELNLPILRTTRDYYCPYCDKVYKSSSKRKAHIQKNHPGAPLLTGLPNPTFSQTVGSVTTAPHGCQWCHKQYASKAKLLQHTRKEHPEHSGDRKRSRREPATIQAAPIDEFIDDPLDSLEGLVGETSELGTPTQLYRLLTTTELDPNR